MQKIASTTLVIGAILTALSALHLCTGSCSEAHNYRLFGLPFEVTGASYFAALLFCHFTSRTSLTAFLLAAGLGAEGYFIYLQKQQIGSWCPLCISIAICLGIAGIYYFFVEKTMKKWTDNLLICALMVLGFSVASVAVSKFDQLQAVEDSIKERIKMGNHASNVEVYVFTDWACPACRSVEPKLEAMIPQITQQATITFVDTVIHPETLNFAPYNIAFMAQNAQQYAKIRQALTELSAINKKPTDQDISQAVAPLGIHYRELPYEDVSLAMRYFDDMVDRFKVTGTPTIAIINPSTKKGKKLAGTSEISQENVLEAIKALR